MYLLRGSITPGSTALCGSAVSAQLAPSAFRVVEVTARPEVLREADEVLICNALMPLVPVRRWEETVWSSRELYHFLAPLCELSG
ncbi:hypothetical protein LNO81_09960 [Klebsiella variicola subsp. variicola]|nr:hypothetical protein [Klebsiella variicola subsp. variicola]